MEMQPQESPSIQETKAQAPHVARQKDQKVFSVTIRKKPDEVYRFWRDFQNLTSFMKDIEEIEVLSPTRSRWHLKLKSGMKVEWESEITEDIPSNKISWQSAQDSTVETAGTVWFESAPANRGCIVRLSLGYKIPGGKLTELVALFTGEDPENLTLTNLRRLKAYLETGEIPTTEGQPSGRDEDNKDQPSTNPSLH